MTCRPGLNGWTSRKVRSDDEDVKVSQLDRYSGLTSVKEEQFALQVT
jgi:hypothetical protein